MINLKYFFKISTYIASSDLGSDFTLLFQKDALNAKVKEIYEKLHPTGLRCFEASRKKAIKSVVKQQLQQKATLEIAKFLSQSIGNKPADSPDFGTKKSSFEKCLSHLLLSNNKFVTDLQSKGIIQLKITNASSVKIIFHPELVTKKTAKVFMREIENIFSPLFTQCIYSTYLKWRGSTPDHVLSQKLNVSSNTIKKFDKKLIDEIQEEIAKTFTLEEANILLSTVENYCKDHRVDFKTAVKELLRSRLLNAELRKSLLKLQHLLLNVNFQDKLMGLMFLSNAPNSTIFQDHFKAAHEQWFLLRAMSGIK